MKYVAWGIKANQFNDNTGNNVYLSYINKDVNGFNNTFASQIFILATCVYNNA